MVSCCGGSQNLEFRTTPIAALIKFEHTDVLVAWHVLTEVPLGKCFVWQVSACGINDLPIFIMISVHLS